jgi:hypothetical protein
MALHESEVTDLIREGLSFLMCREASIMQFNSSDPVFNFAEYTRDFVPKDSNLKDVGQVTSLAKQLDPAIQSTDS